MDLHPGQPQLHDLYAAYLTALERYADAAEQYALSNDPRPRQRPPACRDGAAQLPRRQAPTRPRHSSRRSRLSRQRLLPVAVASAYVNIDPQAGVAFIDSLDMTAYTDNVKSILHSTLGDLLWQQRNLRRRLRSLPQGILRRPHKLRSHEQLRLRMRRGRPRPHRRRAVCSMAVGAETENHTSSTPTHG